MINELQQLNKSLAQKTGLVEYEIERFKSQLNFAEFLCEKHKDKAEDWRKLMKKAVEVVEGSIKNGHIGLSKANQKAEKILAPISKVAKEYTVYCVGHAHIDMNWMWSWPETVATTNDTFTTVLHLMDEFPEFIFSQSQASVYKIMEQHNPSLLEQIVQKVKEGRWEVTASHWVEGDKNIASAESLCRHLLYTRKYMQDLFGLSPEDIPIDWSPDTFGHAHTVPTYLVRGGIKYLYLHRPGAHTEPQPRPQAFWWKAPDGSKVLVRNDMRLGYNGQINPSLVPNSLQTFVNETGLNFSMFVYGVGDHGGGPTRRDLVRLMDMNSWTVYPNIKPATAKEFYQRLEEEGKELPVIDCELNFEFSGCYTTQSLIKKANRYAEKKLVDAESANTLTWACGIDAYPNAELEEGWRDTLFSHFHDILPGSGVHDTRTYTHGLYQKTVAMTTVKETSALRSLAEKIDTSSAKVEVDEDLPSGRYPISMGAGIGYNTANGNCSQYNFGKGSDHRPYLVFNTIPLEREEIIEAVVWDRAWGWGDNDAGNLPFCVVTSDGETVSTQTVETGNYWGHQFVKLAFPVKVPALGYSLYIIKEERCNPSPKGAWQTGFKHHCGYSYYERSPEGIENDFVSVELDMKTGGIESLIDKRTNTVIIDSADPAPILEYGVERMRSMNAWLIEHTGGWKNLNLKSIKRGLDGPYKATIDAEFQFEQSDFTVTYELRANDPNIYIHIRGTWFQRATSQGVPVLRFSVPLAFKDPKTRYEIPFGALDRDMKHGEEVPALRWAQVIGEAQEQDKQPGCLLLNDSKHGHSFVDNRLNLTLIRSSSNPDPLPEIGQHEIHLALQPFTGEMSVKSATAQAKAFNHELKVVNTDAHDGEFPASAGFIKNESDTVVLNAIKKAEEENALILRLYESSGKNTTAKIIFNQELIGKINEVVEVDLLERPVKSSSLETDDSSFTVEVPARGITSVMVRLKAS